MITYLSNDYRNGVVDMNLTLCNSGQKTASASLQYTILDPNGKQVLQTHSTQNAMKLKKGEQNTQSFQWKPEGEILPWTAETPNVYRMIISLLDKKGRVTECVRQEFGFREVKIEDGIFKVNGRKIYIRGTNYHDSNPLTGRYLPLDMIEKDYALFSHHNLMENTGQYSYRQAHYTMQHDVWQIYHHRHPGHSGACRQAPTEIPHPED